MDLHHLKYLLVTAEEGSFQRASERLDVAPSVLSRRIQDLETELGLALFERIGGGIRPSHAGAFLIDCAKRIFVEVEATAEHFHRLAKGQTGVLRVALNGIAPQLPIVPALFRRLRASTPETELKLIPMPSSEQARAIRDGAIDAGFLYANAPAGDGMASLRIATHRFVLAVPVNHPLAKQAEIRLADLTQEDFVLFTRNHGAGTYDRLLARCRAQGLNPRILQETASEHMQLGLVAAGMGISFVLDAVVTRQNRPDIAVRPVLDLAVEEHLELVWRQHDSSIALVRLIALAKAELA